MIPKIIHYCWFGGNPKSELAEHCIASWRKIHPDFEIKEWNESNSDISSNNYVREAFEQGKWAFVSDYVRSKVMFDHGGIYMDTDMELKLPLDEFLTHRAVCGFEVKGVPYSAFWAAEKNHPLAKDFMDYYISQPGFEERINTDIFSEMLEDKYGANRYSDTEQELKEGVVLYPSVYFSQDLPKNYVAHHFNGSWFGGDAENTHKKMVNLYGIVNRLMNYSEGEKYIDKILNEHHLFEIEDILKLFPMDSVKKYVNENS